MRFSLSSRLALLATTTLFALPVQAQETDGASVTLPTLDVDGATPRSTAPVQGFVAPTATAGSKTDTPLIETPQSISVVTRDQMNAQQAQSVGQAMAYSAGVRSEFYGFDTRYDWFSLRGFEAQANSVYRDGLRYIGGNLSGMVEPYGLERVEILRGPASVLYGQNQPGGLVNLVSRHPTDTPQGELRLSAASNDRFQGAFNSSGPVGTDGKWSYSLTGLARDADTQVDYTRDQRVYVAPALTWKPTDNTTLTLLSYYQRDRTNGTQFLPSVGTVFASPFGHIARDRFTSERGFDKFDRTQYGAGYEFQHRFNDIWTVRQNLGYSYTHYNWQQAFGLGVMADQRSLSRWAFKQLATAETFQVDNQAEARFSTGALRHTVLMGFDYANSVWRSDMRGAMATPLDLYAPVYGSSIPAFFQSGNDRNTTQQFGLYAQDQIALGNWRLSLGGRQDWSQAENSDRLADTTRDRNNNALTWRAGLVYLFPNGISPYVSYATSFLPQIDSDINGHAFDPLEGEQYEAGIKFQPTGFNSFIQASVFDLRQRNMLTADPANPLNRVQTGEVRMRGFELEGVASLTQGFRMSAALTLLNSEITESNTPGEQGNRLNGVPKVTASLWADYTFQEGSGALTGLGVAGGVRYIGNSMAGNANLFEVPSSTVFDAAVRYDLSRLGRNTQGMELALNGVNLTDKTYVGSCGSASACYYAPGRTVTATLTARW